MYFYDTNALLDLGAKLFENEEKFYLSTTSLHELEHIKTSKNKDEETRYKARKLVHLLDENPNKYEVIIYDKQERDLLEQYGLDESPDNQICACAETLAMSKGYDNVIFVSNDLCCKTIAKNCFRLIVESVKNNIDEEYKGFKEVVLSDDDMAYFYGHLTENIYELLTNEYIIIRNKDNEIVDKMRWDGEMYQNVKIGTLKSDYFGSIKPYNGDVYQQCVLNSLIMNQVTMIKGVAGTGKSYLALGYLFYLLDKRKIEKIIVFCNTVATNNSAKLGYYPGTKDEKLIDSAIGNMLGSKLGGTFAVERLIQDGKLVLLPMSDIRGYDTSNMNAGVYITEAQNMDISLMKLALQRIGEDCICIIDGDYNTQVDLSQYAGANNGMRRMSEVFRGQDFYGEVELQNIYRSKIAAIAEMM